VNSLRSPLRRAAAIIAGSVIGLAGIVAVASPSVAAPDAPFAFTVTGDSCKLPGGGWAVDWTVTNLINVPATIDTSFFTPVGESTMDGLDVGSTVPAATDGPATGVQTVADNFKLATLTVRLSWGDISSFRYTFTASKPAVGRCATSSPSPSPSDSSPAPSDPASSAPSDPTSSAPSDPASSTPTTSVPTTPTATPTPSQSASTPPAGDAAAWFYDETCDTLTVGVSVPASWDDLTVTFTPSTGAAKTVTAPAGRDTSVDFPASAGLTVKASAKGSEDADSSITYKTPADCSGGLPVTGAAAGSIAAGAVVLLAIGGFLFYLARRRKVKFTA
jgi:LPXTG-motif cell wall-anchored protein